ncbi:MAG: efflux RND transporter periplasmic adaptor subunit [Chromatiaceae bacterium]|nr:efflux RND transporter periplasmic adaptor subunit [Chromatiaceae bacterium]
MNAPTILDVAPAGPTRPIASRGVSLATAASLLLLLTACGPSDEPEEGPPPIRPVRVVTVEERAAGNTVTLTGTIQAKDDVNLAFRIGGQLLERNVNVGDRVTTGQVVARLDPSTLRDAVQAARANLAAAMARLVEARNEVERFEPLLPRGFVSRQMFDQAVEARNAAQAMVDAAEAQVSTAETQLSYTELLADGPGVVTARGAEPGEVVAVGQMIVRLAREGGRDAVFDVPARVKDEAQPDQDVRVSLSTDAQVQARGRVREVSPEADPVTRTFQVRVGLTDPPEALRLGSTVTGTVELGGGAGMIIPAAAMTSAQGRPAVWVMDPAAGTVALRPVDVARYELDSVLIAHGLTDGELVVTAGAQTLRPGQQVRLLGAPPPSAAAAQPGIEARVPPAAEPGPAAEAAKPEAGQ